MLSRLFSPPVRIPDDVAAEIDSIGRSAAIEAICRSRHLSRDVGLDIGPRSVPPVPT